MTDQTTDTGKKQPRIVAYLKTSCGWSNGVRAMMDKYGLEYEEKDIMINPAFRQEMEQKTGQPLSPCVEIDDNILADVSGEEVEDWMSERGLIERNNAPSAVPLGRACSH